MPRTQTSPDMPNTSKKPQVLHHNPVFARTDGCVTPALIRSMQACTTYETFLTSLLVLVCLAPGAKVPLSHSFWTPATGAASFAGALLGPRFFSCALTQLNPESHLYSR